MGSMWRGYFAGESMFHREDNGSKAAILFAISLQKQVGREWMDIQVMTPHMEALGAHEISRALFLQKLKTATEAMNFGSGLNPFRDERENRAEKMVYGDFCKFIE